jgi:hypothetical protein
MDSDDIGYDPEWMHGDSDFMAGDDDFGFENRDCEIPDDDSMLEDVISAATAAGFGYHMAQDEMNERELAEEILRRKEEEREANKPTKVPLWTRHKVKGSKGSPALRAMYKVATGERTTKDPIEYTEEEQRQILDFEGEHDFEW